MFSYVKKLQRSRVLRRAARCSGERWKFAPRRAMVNSAVTPPTPPSIPSAPSLPGTPSAPAAPSLPAACASYESTLHPNVPGVNPQQHSYNLARGAEGLTHVRMGEQSFIIDPRAQKTILLDHAKQEARIFATPPGLALPGQPQIPGMPSGMPAMPSTAAGVKDLGKSMINGHEAQGKLYSFALSKMPVGLPTVPTLAPPPIPPHLPFQPPTQPNMQTVEQWTSTQLHVPMLTRVVGPGGYSVTNCTKAVPCSPPASMFQIPPHYKIIP